jgi:hypothetical protein
MAKVKRVSQEEEEWIKEEIQVIRKLIKQHEERQQRKAEIRAIKRRIRALEKEENQRIENREISEGISVVDVFCKKARYPEEGEALEEESAKTKNVCVVQSMQEEAKKIEHVETYMHVCKCEEKNNAANCIPEKVVETLVKSTGEDKKLLAKDFSEEEITEDQTVEDKADLQVAENKGLGEVGNVIYLLDIERCRRHSQHG